MSIQVDGIVAGYGAIEVLHGVSLFAETKKMTCIIGPNGAGKSTLLKVICGMLKPKQGKVTLDGHEITSEAPDVLVRKGVCYILQGRSVFPYMSVRENLEMGVYIRKDNEQIKKDTDEVLRLFPILRERENQFGGTLSGGEQRMLEIARAILLKPRVMMLDEPSIGLSPKYVDIVYEKIQRLREMGITLLIVEQNVRKVLSIADCAYVLDLGKIAMQGNCGELSKDKKLVELYLGEQ